MKWCQMQTLVVMLSMVLCGGCFIMLYCTASTMGFHWYHCALPMGNSAEISGDSADNSSDFIVREMTPSLSMK